MRLLRFFPLLLGLSIGTAAPAAPGQLQVSADGRHFVGADGKPFFWLGDTAWELFHRLTLEEAEAYLEDRRRKGFNIVQAVVLAELGGLRVPNAHGALPLADKDPRRPNEAYFAHVDRVVERSAAKGIYIAMLPSWGDKFNKKWGEGPEIFTPANARAFGEFLGRRYRNARIVWVLGGDRNPETPEHLAIVRAMAEGLEAGGARQLKTYHPQGGSKSWQWFGQDQWLDFHMFQSGHGEADFPNYRFTREGYALQPPKPVLDGEPRYEDHPVNWKPELGWFGEFDVRQAAYWSMLSGAAGHSYGNHNIWQMWQPGRAPISAARTPWRLALAQPGAAQMGHLRRLFEPRLPLQPADDALERRGSGGGHQLAAYGRGRSRLFAYSPLGEPIAVRLGALRAKRVRASWFDPRTGKSTPIARYASGGSRIFTPPGGARRGNDWLLVLE